MASTYAQQRNKAMMDAQAYATEELRLKLELVKLAGKDSVDRTRILSKVFEFVDEDETNVELQGALLIKSSRKTFDTKDARVKAQVDAYNKAKKLADKAKKELEALCEELGLMGSTPVYKIDRRDPGAYIEEDEEVD